MIGWRVAGAPALFVCRLSASPWVSLSVGVVSAGLLYWALLHRDEHMKDCLAVLKEALGVGR